MALIFFRTEKLNIMIKQLALLPYFQTSVVTSYPDKFFIVSLSPSRQILEQHLKTGHCHFLIYAFQFHHK